MSAAFNIEVPNTPDDVKVTNSPHEPGAAASIRIEFTTTVGLTANIDEIKVRFDKDITPPLTLAADHVLLLFEDPSTAGTTDSPNAPGEGQGTHLSTAPTRRVVDSFGEKDETPGDPNIVEYTLSIPDMDIAEDSVGSITARSMVTIVFSSSAGFTNPIESGTGDKISVGTNKNTYFMKGPDGVESELSLSIDDVKDKRNTTLTITGKGYKKDTTATVWLDFNRNAMIDSNETRLMSELVESDGTFTFRVNVSVPPFKKSSDTLKNYINAMDTEEPKANVISADRMNDMPQFTVDRSLTVSPVSANVGDTVRLELRDYPDGGTIPARPVTDPPTTTGGPIEIAGVSHWPKSSTPVSNGDADFEVVIQNGVPPGLHEISLDHLGADGVDAETKITVGGATLILTPSSAVPNQTISVVGRGFSSRSTINHEDGDKSRVTIGGDPNGLKGTSSPSDLIDGGDKVETDSGGNWAAEIIVPMNDATLTPGTYELKVVDSDGRVGMADLTILPRTLEMSPAAGRVGSTVTVTGKGFPADNSSNDAPNPPNVTISYDGDRRASVTPDSAGNFTVSFKVPSGVGIPSTNAVEADFTAELAGGGTTPITVSQTHNVPEGTITVEPTEVRPGDTITITGAGFAGFEQLTELEVGTRDLTPSPKVNTARDGTFTAQVLIPDFDLGSITVKATVGDTIASATLAIVEETTTMMPEVMMAEEATPDVAFAAVIAEDNLIAVYHFDPATQNEAPNYGYTVYDARPLFMSGNNLDSIEPGQFYTVQVSEDQMGVTLGNQTVDLYAPFTPIRW